jgi:LuxR family maltose regulon positive regulatory protein
MIERLDTGRARTHLEMALERATQSRRSRDRDLHRLVSAVLLARTTGADDALSALHAPVPSAGRVRLIERSSTALEAQLLLALGASRRPARLLHDARAIDVVPVAIDIALASDDVAAARRQLDEWRVHEVDLFGAVDRGIREALVLDAESRPADSNRAMVDAINLAAQEAIRSPFVDAPGAARLVRRCHAALHQPFVSSILESSSLATRPLANQRLPEPLTERELTILEFLPSRLGNSELATELYVSVNTLKTHLRHIYRKLGVADRDAAVERADELGLL